MGVAARVGANQHPPALPAATWASTIRATSVCSAGDARPGMIASALPTARRVTGACTSSVVTTGSGATGPASLARQVLGSNSVVGVSGPGGAHGRCSRPGRMVSLSFCWRVSGVGVDWEVE